MVRTLLQYLHGGDGTSGFRLRHSHALSLMTLALFCSACSKKEDTYGTPGWDMRVTTENLKEIAVRPAPAGPVVSVVTTRAEEGRTRAQLGSDGGTLLWTAGDTFQAEFIQDGEFYAAEFSTQDDGVASAIFTTESVLDGDDFVCVFPEYRKSYIGKLDGHRSYDVVLPPRQEAVAGNIAPGLNRAMACADHLENGSSLTFYNLPALLCFRLSGAVVSSLREIRFLAPVPIAEGWPFFWQDGLPVLSDIKCNLDQASCSVTLEGSFSEDTEYYLALWPKEVNGFEMTFSDGEGNFTTLRSSKTISFKRSGITDFGTIMLGDTFTGAPAVSTEPVLYHQATTGTKPVTMTVIPDGFREEELPQFEWLAKRGIDLLLDTEPYRSYADRFNIWILKVASAESGASITNGNGTITTQVNDYFGIKWGADSYGDMRGDDNKIFNFVSANCPDIVNGIHSINEVAIVIIVNDARYGGKSWMWNTGKAYCIIPFLYNGMAVSWSYPKLIPNSESDPSAGYHDVTPDEYAKVGRYNAGDWRHVMLHELGHGFARLHDEYWKNPTSASANDISKWQNWPVPYGLNISATYSNPPWQEFIDRREALMAIDPNYGRIGVFQGGATHMFNAWRSERISCMIDNRQYFSAWQRYLIAKRIMTLSGDLSSFSFDSWLAKDVTIDPVRDLPTRAGFDWTQDPPFPLAGYSAPPGFVEE